MGNRHPNTLKVKDQNLRKCLIPEKKKSFATNQEIQGMKGRKINVKVERNS
jgi:hypothetical protein